MWIKFLTEILCYKPLIERSLLYNQIKEFESESKKEMDAVADEYVLWTNLISDNKHLIIEMPDDGFKS